MGNRLDVEIFSRGLAKSRESAKDLIILGKIAVNGKIVKRPSVSVLATEIIEIIGSVNPYVGRGGIKFFKAICFFGLDLNGKICADIGASTGGFTDCMLQNGAKKVFAVDVGHGQLDSRLLQDNRVVNLEKTNIRNMNIAAFTEKIDTISVDVSFISLRLVIPKIREIFQNCGEVILLIKPQFEAGKQNLGKNGIIKDPKIHVKVLNGILSFCSEFFIVEGLTYSPIMGGNGNIEYLLLGRINGNPCAINIEKIVADAFRNFGGKTDESGTISEF